MYAYIYIYIYTHTYTHVCIYVYNYDILLKNIMPGEASLLNHIINKGFPFVICD